MPYVQCIFLTIERRLNGMLWVLMMMIYLKQLLKLIECHYFLIFTFQQLFALLIKVTSLVFDLYLSLDPITPIIRSIFHSTFSIVRWVNLFIASLISLYCLYQLIRVLFFICLFDVYLTIIKKINLYFFPTKH